jgi:two-component system LytT family response regulator
MIKAIIIDDEKHCLITLEDILKQTGRVEILRCIQKSTEAEKFIRELQPDIVFMDIEMPALNGFEILNKFEDLFFKVVFTTAYDQYAIKALKMNALDYLQKPISYQDVEEVLKKYKQKEFHQTKEQINHIYEFSKGKVPDTIALSTQEGFIFVTMEEIMYVEGEGSYSKIVMCDEKKHLISKSVSTFEEVLQDNPLFFRPHKSFLVNLKFIKQYIRGDGGEIVMKDRKNITVSRSKKQEFLDFFHKI